MKLINRYLFWTLALAAVILFFGGKALIHAILQGSEVAENASLFIPLLLLGLLPDHLRKRKLNNFIKNPYHNGRK